MALIGNVKSFNLAPSAWSGTTLPTSASSGSHDIVDGITELSFEIEQNQQDITSLNDYAMRRQNTLQDFNIEITCTVDAASGSTYTRLRDWIQSNSGRGEDRHINILFDNPGGSEPQFNGILLHENISFEFSDSHELTFTMTLNASGGLPATLS